MKKLSSIFIIINFIFLIVIAYCCFNFEFNNSIDSMINWYFRLSYITIAFTVYDIIQDLKKNQKQQKYIGNSNKHNLS